MCPDIYTDTMSCTIYSDNCVLRHFDEKDEAVQYLQKLCRENHSVSKKVTLILLEDDTENIVLSISLYPRSRL
jgi:hypothetical protein